MKLSELLGVFTFTPRTGSYLNVRFILEKIKVKVFEVTGCNRAFGGPLPEKRIISIVRRVEHQSA